MRNKLIIIAVIFFGFLLFSCGSYRQGNFNKQKFTGLKKINESIDEESTLDGDTYDDVVLNSSEMPEVESETFSGELDYEEPKFDQFGQEFPIEHEENFSEKKGDFSEEIGIKNSIESSNKFTKENKKKNGRSNLKIVLGVLGIVGVLALFFLHVALYGFHIFYIISIITMLVAIVDIALLTRWMIKQSKTDTYVNNDKYGWKIALGIIGVILMGLSMLYGFAIMILGGELFGALLFVNAGILTFLISRWMQRLVRIHKGKPTRKSPNWVWALISILALLLVAASFFLF
jgi:hypothetical protein